jgi:hypothetical protein
LGDRFLGLPWPRDAPKPNHQSRGLCCYRRLVQNLDWILDHFCDPNFCDLNLFDLNWVDLNWVVQNLFSLDVFSQNVFDRHGFYLSENGR